MAKNNSSDPTDGAIDTLVGLDSQVEGTFNIATGIKVEGKLKGSLTSNGTLSVGPAGVVEATIKVREAIIAGTVIGRIDAEHRIELESTSKVYADLNTTLLVIEEGAVFHGQIESGEPKDSGKQRDSSGPANDKTDNKKNS